MKKIYTKNHYGIKTFVSKKKLFIDIDCGKYTWSDLIIDVAVFLIVWGWFYTLFIYLGL